MKNIYTLIISVCLALLSSSQAKTYKGAWFEIKYPAGFFVKPSQKSPSDANRYESVFFRSPDGIVEFYIFSPQWNGEANDIALQKSEKLVNTKKQTEGDKQIKWWTIASKNGSYTRMYQETWNETSNTKWVVGIKYKNPAAYNKYKNQYLMFKASLVQYAD